MNKLRNEISIPNHNKINFNRVYVLRNEQQLINQLLNGYYGDIKFICKDKYGTNNINKKYIAKGFPLDMNDTDFMEYFGEEKQYITYVRRLKFNGAETTSIQFMWSSIDINPPKSISLFIDYDDSPKFDIEEWVSELRCFHCQMKGHIAKNCAKQPICPICGREHAMKNCSRKEEQEIFCCHCKKMGVNAFTCDCKKEKIVTTEKVTNNVENLEYSNESIIKEIHDLKTFMTDKLKEEIVELKQYIDDRIDDLLYENYNSKEMINKQGGGGGGEGGGAGGGGGRRGGRGGRGRGGRGRGGGRGTEGTGQEGQ